jgi:hypothetical protein
MSTAVLKSAVMSRNLAERVTVEPIWIVAARAEINSAAAATKAIMIASVQLSLVLTSVVMRYDFLPEMGSENADVGEEFQERVSPRSETLSDH